MPRYEVGSCEWYLMGISWSLVGTISTWNGGASGYPDPRCPLRLLQVQGTGQAVAVTGGTPAWLCDQCVGFVEGSGTSQAGTIFGRTLELSQYCRFSSVNHRGLVGLAWSRIGLRWSLMQEVCIGRKVYRVWEQIGLEDESKVTTRLCF